MEAAAANQSVTEYLFPEIAIPNDVTGIILELFPSIDTGKTYFNALCWHVLAATIGDQWVSTVYKSWSPSQPEFASYYGSYSGRD